MEVQGGAGIPAEQTVNKLQLQLCCVGYVTRMQV